ncbi:MAG: HYR domain-containing protein [Flavobacteriales bacterium]|nr:HYR domain-containing protein [Flavobacteriales bacterium]
MPTTQRRSSVIKALLPVLMLLLTEAAHASYSWQFGQGIGTNQEDRVTDVAFDPNDQFVYAVGYSENNNDLSTGLEYSENDQGFLIKFNETGAAIWQLEIGGSGLETAESVAVGTDGTVYMTGSFTQTCKFFNGTGSQAGTTLTSAGGSDVYLAAYNPNGTFLWATRIGGSSEQTAPRICVDATGISIVGESISSFTAGSTTAVNAASNSIIALSSDKHVFLCRYSLTGVVNWVKEAYTSGTGNDAVGTVASDGFKIYVSLLGASATLNWINGGVSLTPFTTHTSGGVGDQFLTAFDINGSHLWTNSISDPTADYHGTLAIATGCDAVYITGEVGPGAQFANGTTHPATATSDAFYIAKLNPNAAGNFTWVQFGNTDGNDEFVGCDIAYGTGDMLYITGRFRGSVNYQTRIITATSLSDGFLLTAKATTGTPLELEAINGSNLQESWSVAVGPLGGVAIGGEFLGNVVANSTIISSNGGKDGYVALAQMGVRAIGLQNPTHWNAPAQVCAGQGPFDLGALLVPPHMGAGVSVISLNAVVNPANALGAINDMSARFTNSTSWVVIDLNDTIPAGEALQMRFRKSTATTSGSVYLRLSTSMNASGPFQAVDSISSSNAWYMWSSKLLPANARYVRIAQKVGSDNAEVDGLRFAYGSYPTGAWSGNGVSGSSWSPTTAGAVPLTYTVGTGTCARSTTRTVNVLAAPSPGTISASATTVCPGGSVTFTASGTNSGTLTWQKSTDGFASSTIIATNTTTATLSSVTAVTKVRVIASNVGCSDVISNVITITPQDLTGPVLTCPIGTITAQLGTNCQASIPNLAVIASASDNCSAATITQNPAAGTLVSVNTVVTITAVDAFNNTSTCTKTVVVQDGIAPQFTLCPSNRVVSTGGGPVVVNYPTPTATDNCGTPTVTRTVGLASGSLFPVGTTTVTWRARDAALNETFCTFTVTVQPNTVPVINCPNAITAYTPAGSCTALVNYSVPVGTDDSGGPTVQSDLTGYTSGSQFPLGQNIQQYTMRALDGGTATCSFVITVLDTIKPVVVCSPSLTLTSPLSQCGAVVNYIDPSVSENCMGCAPQNIPGHTFVGTFQGNTYWRSWSATPWNVANAQALSIPNGHLAAIGSPSEQAWLTSTLFGQLGSNAPFWVGLSDEGSEGAWYWTNGEVLDHTNWNQSPLQPDNFGGSNYAYINGFGTDAWDDAPGGTNFPYLIEIDCLPALSVTLATGLVTGSSFPVGTTPVVYQMTDHGGNTGTCSFNITVQDLEAPVLTCPVNISVEAPANACAANVTYAATATDNCAGTPSVNYSIAPGSDFPIGTTEVTVTATDGTNASVPCFFSVRVRDVTAPTITGLPAAMPSGYDPGTCNATVPDLLSLCIISDVCSAPLVISQSPALGSTMIADQWIVITATDTANNTRSDSTFVTLNAPAILAVCPTDVVGSAPGGSCSGSLAQPTPSGLSSCDSWTQVAGPADWSNLAIDTIPAVYEITNGYNTLTCSFNAIINDIEPPSVYCPLNDSLEIFLDGTCSVAFPDLRDSISIYDCTAIDTNIMWPPADTVFTTDTVVWMTMDVYDIYGNHTDNDHWIWIRDTIAPTITCPLDMDVQAAAGVCSALVELPGPASLGDACGFQPWTANANNGNWPIGDSTVVYSVQDVNGNSASCSFTVHVTPSVLPDLAYSPSTFCPTPSLQYPVNTMPVGGTFQCNTCTSIIAPDGGIQPSAMQLGTNEVIYYAPAASCYDILSDTAWVTLNPIVDGGADRFVNACSLDAPFQLVDSLGGTPQAGGSWFFGGSPHPDVFDPSTDPPGAYSYSISGPCGSAGADVVISISVPMDPAFTYGTGPFCTTGASVAPDIDSGTFTSSDPANLIVDANTGAIDLANSQPGIYQVTQVVGSGTCTTSHTEVIEIIAPPSISTGAYGPSCTNAGAIILLATPAGGTWSGAGISGGTFEPNTAGPGSHTITYTAGDPGCTSSATTIISVGNGPSATISYIGSPYCASAGSATVIRSGTADGTYSSAAGLSINTATGTVNLGASVPGNYVVTYTIPVASGCAQFQTTATITVSPAPIASISYSGSPYCSNAGIATVTISGLTGGTFSSTAGLSINAVTGAVTLGTSTIGTYTVNYTIAAAGGCAQYVRTASITIDPQPNATITAGGPLTFCPGGSVTLTSSSSTGNLWSTGATTQSVTVSTSGTFSVTVTNGNGCSATSAGTTVTVNPNPPLPTITAGGPLTFCPGGSVTLTSSSNTGNLWSTGATTQSITVSTSGAYSVTVTNGNGCSSTSAGTTVTVNPNPPLPTITAGGPLTFCPGGSVTLTSSSNTGNLWSTGATTQSITVSTSGAYSVTVTNGNGCSATSAGTTVTVNPNPPLPTITAGGPLTFCPGGSVTLTSSSNTGNVWSTGATTQSITASTSGTYSVTVTNGNGCSATSGNSTVVVIDNSAPTILCPSNVVVNAAPGACSAIATFSVTATDDCVANPSITYSQVPGTLFPIGSTSVLVTASDGVNTSSPCMFTVTVNAATVDLSYGITTVCRNSAPIAPTIASPTGGAFSDANQIGTTNATNGVFDPALATPGFHTLGYVFAGACTSHDWFTIEVVEAPDAGTDGTISICSSAPAESLLMQLAGTPAANGTWSGPSPVFGGMYDPATMDPGVYTYSVAGVPPCAASTSTVTVTETVQSTNTTTVSSCDSYTWSVNGQTYTTSGTYSAVVGCSNEVLVLSNTLPGTTCNDGNANTINDTYDASCQCAGTPVVFDCLGVANGTTLPGTNCDDGNATTMGDVFDTSCICAGTPFTVDCNTTINGTASIDACGVCSGGTTGIAPNSTCTDCMGVVNGTALPGSACDDGNATTMGDVFDTSCICAGTPFTVDCNSTINGTASLDACGVCSGGTTGIAPNSTCTDCMGVVNGTALPGSACDDGNATTMGDVFDTSCICAGTPFTVDCNSTINGTASLDSCGVCSGGTTGIAPNSTCTDCMGVVNGTALPGSACDDGNATTMGDVFDSSCICAGTPFTVDCNSTINGTASLDACGVCSGGTTGIAPNSTCTDCMGVVNGTALPGSACDDGNATTMGDVFDSSCICAGTPFTVDCNSTINGAASLDACGVCSGGTTGIAPNSTCTDCMGVVNGTALPGSACDDGNATTMGDVFDTSCICAGTPFTVDCNSTINGTASLDACGVLLRWNHRHCTQQHLHRLHGRGERYRAPRFRLR